MNDLNLKPKKVKVKKESSGMVGTAVTILLLILGLMFIAGLVYLMT